MCSDHWRCGGNLKAPQSLIRRGDWVDQPSVNIPALYVMSGYFISEGLMGAGERPQADSVLRTATEVAAAAHLDQMFPPPARLRLCRYPVRATRLDRHRSPAGRRHRRHPVRGDRLAPAPHHLASSRSVPEGPEVDLDKLREQIDEEIERTTGRLIRVIALSTALLAACAAIASLEAGATVNEALVLKTEATQFQARASDQWAYYQAKGIKGAIAAATVAAWRAAGKTPPAAEVRSQSAKYAADQKAIADSARRDGARAGCRSGEADALLHRHHGFAYAVAFFQIAIALGAVAALTKSRPVLAASVFAGAVGIGFFVAQLSA